MEPQSFIPVIKTVDRLIEYIESGYSGIANVELNIEIVDYLLSKNLNNRRVKQHSLKAYISSFQKTGYECINLMHISADGELIDGQHRLLALKALLDSSAIQPPYQFIHLGTEQSIKLDIDNGSSRTAGDIFRINGYITDQTISSALNQYAILMAAGTRYKFTASELIDIYDNDFKQVLDIGNFGCIKGVQIFGRSSYRPAPWVVCGFRVCQKVFGTDKMKFVYEQFYTGDDVSLPMVRFRYWVISIIKTFRFVPRTKDGKKMLGYFFYSVKKCLNNEPVTKLYSRELGAVVNGKPF